MLKFKSICILDVVIRLVEFLNSNEVSVIIFVLRAIGNIVIGDDS